MTTTLIYNIGELYTMRSAHQGALRGQEMSRTERLNDAAVVIDNGIIRAIGPSATLLKQYAGADEKIDAAGKMVTPGLVDPHTHLVHASSREHELAQKLAGAKYLDILASGGGILSTVRATRKATEEDLIAQAKTSLMRMSSFGVTTVEVKSGYGLDWETEYKQLRAVKALQEQQPLHLVSTFLAAHAIPPEYLHRSDEYIDAVIDMLPQVASEGLAEFCDVFCERGVFSVTQSERLLLAAKRHGLRPKIHADEIESLGGASLAARIGAISADHLLVATDEDLEEMSVGNVIAVLLPGTSWNLGETPARARTMIDQHQLPVAIATDYNPGSCPTENIQLIMAFASHLLRLTPIEVLCAVTRNAAYAIGRGEVAGQIEVGRQADLVLWQASNPDYIVYHFGVNHADKVWIGGQMVVSGGNCLWL